MAAFTAAFWAASVVASELSRSTGAGPAGSGTAERADVAVVPESLVIVSPWRAASGSAAVRCGARAGRVISGYAG
jgi:hypothetical protein